MVYWITWPHSQGQTQSSSWTTAAFTVHKLSGRWLKNDLWCSIYFSVPIIDWPSSGMKCKFLPSYSPDFNPIELTFSKFKAYIKWRQHILVSIIGDDDNDIDCILFLHDAIWSITLKDAEGYFRHCSYCWIECIYNGAYLYCSDKFGMTWERFAKQNKNTGKWHVDSSQIHHPLRCPLIYPTMSTQLSIFPQMKTTTSESLG